MRRLALATTSLSALLLAACAPPAETVADVSPAQEETAHHDHAAHHDHDADVSSDVAHGPVDGTLALFEGAVFVPPGDRDVTAAFGTFAAGDRAVKILSAKADFAQAVELHTHQAGEDGKMAMRQVESFDVPANGQHTLKRGGDHMMLFGVDRAALEVGRELSVTVTVQFEDGSMEEVTLPLTVQDL